MTRDPGLQPERTALAWHRTGVSGSLVGAVAVLAAAHHDSIGLVVLAAAVATATAGAAGLASTRPQPGLAGRLPSPWWRLLAGAAVPVLLAVVGVALALQG